LILVNYVLEAIPVFWHTLAHILKGVLERIGTCCFNFLWKGSSGYKGSHLARWTLIATPKSQGCWDLKDIHLCGRSLATKSLWNLHTIDSLWRRIIIHKYIAPNTLLDWIRMERRSIQNVSNQWKSMTLAFRVIGNYLAWRVGIGEDRD